MPDGSEQENTTAECEFCQIVAGKQSVRLIHETATTLAFFPLRPAVVGHTLVIPKVHISSFLELADARLIADLAVETVNVGQALQRALNPPGMNAITSAGGAASQTIFHLHIHVVPRHHDDAMGNIWPSAKALPEEHERSVAELVRRESS